jgi:eukaryotic-like serine/threonine-protein kinase
MRTCRRPQTRVNRSVVTSTRPDTSSGSPADLLGDRYSLGEPIGRGRSTVYRAEDVRLRRPVAVKQVRLFDGGPEDSTGIRRRAMREAHAAARLSDPHVVTVYDVIEERDSIWLVMELVEAPSLSKLVAEYGPLDARRAARIGLDVLSALTAAHAVGVVHRDVKPANVMVLPHDRAKLADFGVAKMRDDTQVTAAGLVIGSPAYMAPEQARAERAGPAADLWALGATLYFGVEGLSPFPGNNAIAVATAVIYGLPRPAERAGPLAPLLEELLAKDPDDRPPAADVRSALRHVASGRAGAGAPGAGGLAGSGAASPSDTPVAPAATASSGLSPASSPATPPEPPPLPPGAPKHSGGASRRRLMAEHRSEPPPVPPPPPPATPAGGPDVTTAGPAGDAGSSASPGIAEWLAAANLGQVDESVEQTAGPASGAEVEPADEHIETAADETPAEREDVPPAPALAGEVERPAEEAGAADEDDGRGEQPADEPPTIVIEDDDRPALGVPTPPGTPGPTATAATAHATPDQPATSRFRHQQDWRRAGEGAPPPFPVGIPPVEGDIRTKNEPGGTDGGDDPATVVIEDDDRPALGVAEPRATSALAAGGVARHGAEEAGDEGPAASRPEPAWSGAGAPSTGGPPPLIRTIDGSGPGRRRPAVMALVAVAALLLGAMVVRAATGGDDGGGTEGESSGTTAPATTAPPDEGTAAPTTTTTAPPTTTTAAPAVPAGWSTYTDPAGSYTIAHPPGWQVQATEGTRTRFREPGTGTYLMVDWTAAPRPDPVADWQSQSENFRAGHDNYRTVRIEKAQYRDYNAAVWEFAYRDGGADLHVANLGFVTGGRGYALYFQTHEENWASSQELFRQFQQAFRPAGGA